jgi:hypothetical protein
LAPPVAGCAAGSLLKLSEVSVAVTDPVDPVSKIPETVACAAVDIMDAAAIKITRSAMALAEVAKTDRALKRPNILFNLHLRQNS